MGNCISHVSSLCRGKAPFARDPTINVEGDNENGINSRSDIGTNKQIEEERLGALRIEAKILERERLKKAQAVAQAILQKEHVQVKLAEHEEERKRLAFDVQKRNERHALLARRDCVRKYVINEILDAGVDNIMKDEKKYEEIYRDWRGRNGIVSVQRLRHHYHRDGTVSAKVFEVPKRRRHHRKKPFGYGYIPPPELEPVGIDRERVESYHSMDLRSATNVVQQKNVNTSIHLHKTLKCWHGSSIGDYSSDEEMQHEALARRDIPGTYVFMDEAQAEVSSRPISRLIEEFGSKDGDYIPSGSISSSLGGFYHGNLCSNKAIMDRKIPTYPSKFIGSLCSHSDDPESISENNDINSDYDISKDRNRGITMNNTLSVGGDTGMDDLSVTAEELAVNYSALLIEKAIQMGVNKIGESM